MLRVEEKFDVASLQKPHVFKIIPPGIDIESKELKIDRPLRLCALGCADGGVAAMNQVVELMKRLAAGEAFDIILILGDNFDSRDPAISKSHSAFLTHLHNLFSAHPILKKIPKFVILGNHDVIDKNNQFNPEMMRAQIQHTFMKLIHDPKTGEMQYVKNSLTGEPEFDFEKIKLFTPLTEDTLEVIIPYEQLIMFENQWHMPRPYYSVAWGDNVEIICINTNSLVSDYLKHLDPLAVKNPWDQIPFIFDRMNNSPAMTLFCAGHHPMVNANDKRTINSDHPDYITPKEYMELTRRKLAETEDGKEESPPKSNHTDILSNILFHPGDEEAGIPMGPGYRVTAFFVAHHHAIDLFNDGKRVQIKAGGAGGPPPLQNRFSFENPEYLPAFLKNNGVVSVYIPPGFNPEIVVDLHGIADPEIQLSGMPHPHLKLSLKKVNAIAAFFNTAENPSLNPKIIKLISDYATDDIISKIIKPSREEKVEKLSHVIISACQQYQRYLALNPPPKPWQVPNWWLVPKRFRGKVDDRRGDDVVLVDALLNYFNSHELIRFEESITFLQAILIRVGVKTVFKEYAYPQWYMVFDAALQQFYNVTYDAFIATPSLLHGKKEGVHTDKIMALEFPKIELSDSAEPEGKEIKQPIPVSKGGILSRLLARASSPEKKEDHSLELKEPMPKDKDSVSPPLSLPSSSPKKEEREMGYRLFTGSSTEGVPVHHSAPVAIPGKTKLVTDDLEMKQDLSSGTGGHVLTTTGSFTTIFSPTSFEFVQEFHIPTSFPPRVR